MPPLKKRKLDGADLEDEENSSSTPSRLNETTTQKAATKSASPDIEPQKTFTDLGIIDSLADACKNLGYKFPTPIQVEAVPLALQGQDIIGLAETGSGKTAAFALPMLQALMKKPRTPTHFGLVLCPTRELAFQISEAINALGALINVRTTTIVGGMDMVSQAIALSKNPHIIVATPGRLLDHLENTKGFALRKLEYLVMDEADRLLEDHDFLPILTKILKVLPRERHTYLFSATMTSAVESLQRASLNHPARISISSTFHTVSTLQQSWMLMSPIYKDTYLVHILHTHSGHRTIIFTRTVHETQRVALLLRFLGFPALPLHGQLSQSSRLSSLQKFRSRERDILVATDVAARGLDIPSVDLVINFDLPGDSRTYIHRVGRTARAGKSGKALSFVTQYDAEIWLGIEHALGTKVKQDEIEDEEIMVLQERVGEARRETIREMREQDRKNEDRKRRKTGRGGKVGKDRNREDMDREEG